MNQILYTIESEQEKNRMNSIVLFFGIVIIIFGILLITTGGYSLATAKAERDEAIEAAKVPNIELSSENNQVKINVTHSREIKKIEYYWNDEEKTVLDKQGSENVIETLDIPSGKNILKVEVTDAIGKTSNITQEFAYEGTYMDVSVVGNKSVKIVVTDVKGLQSVTYKWGDEGQDTIAYPGEEDPTTIEVVSDIPIGLNKIIVKAVNNYNEIETKEQSIQGITRPTISINPNEEKTIINLKINDDQGIQSYSYRISNAPIELIVKDGKLVENIKEKLTEVLSETKEGNAQKEITEQINFNKGFNYIEITITNIEGAEETFSGWCAK